jgi:hypothetical protein
MPTAARPVPNRSSEGTKTAGPPASIRISGSPVFTAKALTCAVKGLVCGKVSTAADTAAGSAPRMMPGSIGMKPSEIAMISMSFRRTLLTPAPGAAARAGSLDNRERRLSMEGFVYGVLRDGDRAFGISEIGRRRSDTHLVGVALLLCQSTVSAATWATSSIGR